MVIASFGMMLVGKVDTVLVERARIAVYDASAPIYAALAQPLRQVNTVITEIAGLWGLRDENARLRDENEQLRKWQTIALTLDVENRRLKAALHWIPDPDASYVTARVVADAGGVYAKAVLLSLGPNHGLHKGQIALDERGLVGRITEVGTRTARVLLITDMNSRVPVILESSRSHAILAGTNGPLPRLQYWSEGTVPKEGERVVTSAEANAFPANLPVGTVRYNANGVPEIEPDAQLRDLDIVRIFDYGLTGFTAPEATVKVTPGRH
jgi:rod shape-determining protein MreC